MWEAIDAIWEGLKWFLGIFKGLFGVGWQVITGLVTISAAMWGAIASGVDNLATMGANVWSALSGSKDAMTSLISAGVPAAVVNGAAYAGNFLPLNYILSCCVAMFGMFVGSAAVRIVKSWLPTVS